jgi:hypothetical protein
VYTASESGAISSRADVCYPRRTLRLAAVGLISCLGTACTAQRLVAPPPLPPATDRKELLDTKIVLRSFEVTNASSEDLSHDSRKALERAFVASLVNSAYFGAIYRDIGGRDPLPEGAVALDVAVRVDQESDRTYVFDAVFFYPFLGTLPFVPEWGHANVEISWSLRAGKDVEGPMKVRIESPYTMLFYSWYRVGPVEDAFQRAHENAFKVMTSRLLVQLERREAKRHREIMLASGVETSSIAASTSTRAAAVVAELEAHSVPATTHDEPVFDPMRAMPGAGERIHLPHEGIGIVSEPFTRAAEDRGLLLTYLSALGGLEAALTRGSAGVSSSVATPGGPTQPVASGNARSRGYRFSLYKPPETTGFFFPPSIGFLSQQIDISDFRQNIPFTFVPGSTEIPAVTRDAVTGSTVDANAPVTYQLNLKSGFIGQGVGLNLVIGTEDVQLFSTLRAAVNVFEVRHVDVLIDESHHKGYSVAAFRSINAGAQIGLALPIINLAIRAAIEWSYYAEFKYPEITDETGTHSPQFRSAVVYNPTKMVNERLHLNVEGASLWTLDGQISLVYLF